MVNTLLPSPRKLPRKNETKFIISSNADSKIALKKQYIDSELHGHDRLYNRQPLCMMYAVSSVSISSFTIGPCTVSCNKFTVNQRIFVVIFSNTHIMYL